MKIRELYSAFCTSNGVSTDTRSITKNQIFFALSGENFNGNEYASMALSKGAKLVVIDEDKKDIAVDKKFIVKDVLESLQELASFHRSQLTIPILAITGSNGKTTTKELIRAVLSAKYRTFATKGNLNNHIGVPLSLLSISEKDEIAIIEMGANHVGEIASYCSWINPTHGLITNIGKAHLEGFGGVAGVIEGKTELYKNLLKNDGVAFYNSDDTVLSFESSNLSRRVTYGKNKMADYSAEIIESTGLLIMEYRGRDVYTNLSGAYNFYNILASIAIGMYFKVPVDIVIHALSSYQPNNNRSQSVTKSNIRYILDAYNANPSSVEVALKNLSVQINKGKKVAILGDMYELGENELQEHQNIILKAVDLKIDKIICVGEKFYSFKKEFKEVVFYKTTEIAKQGYLSELSIGDLVLVKGSRAMHLETLLD